jgi:hypothetical protein
MTNVEKYKSDLKALVELGDKMSFGLLLGPGPAEKHVKSGKRSQAEKFLDDYAAEARGSFERDYQQQEVEDLIKGVERITKTIF